MNRSQLQRGVPAHTCSSPCRRQRPLRKGRPACEAGAPFLVFETSRRHIDRLGSAREHGEGCVVWYRQRDKSSASATSNHVGRCLHTGRNLRGLEVEKPLLPPLNETTPLAVTSPPPFAFQPSSTLHPSLPPDTFLYHCRRLICDTLRRASRRATAAAGIRPCILRHY